MRICSSFLFGYMFLGCDGTTFRTQFEDVEPGILYASNSLTDAPEFQGQLRIINHNIKFGYGRLKNFFECEGTRYNMSEAELLTHLEALSAFIRATNPDILILQEVDVNSRRSLYLDQTQYLLDNTDLNYGVYASQHRADYAPSDGLGKLDFGNAILSKWPISESERHALPLVSEHAGYYQYFYFKRHILRAKIDLPWDDQFYAVNTHLEAFSYDGTLQKQIDQFHSHLADLDNMGVNWIAAGDLNTLPNGSEVVNNFPDDCPGYFQPDDYAGQEDWLDALFEDYDSLMQLSDYQADNRPWFTYSGDENIPWGRTLDYMFTSKQETAYTWHDRQNEGYVIQSVEQGGHDTTLLSDHAPIRGVLEVNQ